MWRLLNQRFLNRWVAKHILLSHSSRDASIFSKQKKMFFTFATNHMLWALIRGASFLFLLRNKMFIFIVFVFWAFVNHFIFANIKLYAMLPRLTFYFINIGIKWQKFSTDMEIDFSRDIKKAVVPPLMIFKHLLTSLNVQGRLYHLCLLPLWSIFHQSCWTP